MKLAKSRLITLSLVGLTACSGLVLASTKSYADNDSATDEVNITVPVACTMTGTIATGQEHIATLQPGTYSGASGSAYENGIGKTTLATFCNDYNGFSIYAIGFTGETEGDNTLVGTSASGGATIPTKVYESTDTTSNWSMKVTKVTDTSAAFNPNNMTITNSFDSWHTVPDDYTKVAEYHASTGSSATDQSLGAKVETTYASYISTTQPADTYTGKVKYVMVHPYDHAAPTDTLVMQNVSTWGSSVTAGQEVTAIDARDGKSYTVARLADDNLWMTQNLDFDITDGGADLDSNNTDVPSSWNDAGNLTDTYATSDTTWEWRTDAPESYDIGDTYWNGSLNTSGRESSGYITNDGDSHYYLGNYYNWTAAVAMADSSSYTSETDVDQSICPAGWMLPKDGSETGSGSFQNLVSQYWDSSSNMMTSPYMWESPLYFPLSGTWGGELGGVGISGYFWSSVVYDVDYAAELYFNYDGSVSPGYDDYRAVGLAVRCVAR